MQVIPGNTPEYQEAGDVGNRALWYGCLVPQSSQYAEADLDFIHQGCLCHYGHLLPCVLRNGLPCPSRTLSMTRM